MDELGSLCTAKATHNFPELRRLLWVMLCYLGLTQSLQIRSRIGSSLR